MFNLLKWLFNPDRFVLYMGGGGGGGGGDSRTVQDLPEWAKPYAKQTLGLAEGLTTTKDAEGNIIAPSKYERRPEDTDVLGADPLQRQAYQGVGGMQIPGQTGEASNIAQQVAYRALNDQYQPGYFGNQFQAPQQYRPSRFDYMGVNAPDLQQYQMGPAERVSTGSFTQPGMAAQYMSPYIEQALAPQLREAQRTSDILGTQEAGQAVKQGAFGGSRAGLLEAERQRNLATQMGDIRAKGLQSAFEQAQQLYGTEAQRQMAAQQANQAAGLTIGGQNLAAQLGVQQLGAGQDMQAKLANQQAYQNMLAQREAARQFGYGQQMTAAQQRAQFGQAAQQLAEQSRQFGAGYRQQGLSTALQGAGQLGNLGQAEFGQQKDIYGLQNQFGAQQRAIDQERINQRYQDFLSEQRHPYQQLEFMSNILRGTPMGTVQTMYQAPPSPVSQLAGLGMGAYGASKFFKKGGKVSNPKNAGPLGLANLSLQQILNRA